MKHSQSQSAYFEMQRFADLTKKLIMQGNIARAKKCLQVAEQLLLKGSNIEKLAIVNVFVFSVSSFMEMHNCSISQLFPASLQAEYLDQINASGV
jgi:hypothetical protein